MTVVVQLAAPRAVQFVRLRDRGLARLISILEAYEAGHMQTVTNILEDSVSLLDEFRQVPGVAGL